MPKPASFSLLLSLTSHYHLTSAEARPRCLDAPPPGSFHMFTLHLNFIQNVCGMCVQERARCFGHCLDVWLASVDGSRLGNSFFLSHHNVTPILYRVTHCTLPLIDDWPFLDHNLAVSVCLSCYFAYQININNLDFNGQIIFINLSISWNEFFVPLKATKYVQEDDRAIEIWVIDIMIFGEQNTVFMR